MRESSRRKSGLYGPCCSARGDRCAARLGGGRYTARQLRPLPSRPCVSDSPPLDRPVAGLLPAMAAASGSGAAQNGQIQYSDLPPPPGVSDKDILAPHRRHAARRRTWRPLPRRRLPAPPGRRRSTPNSKPSAEGRAGRRRQGQGRWTRRRRQPKTVAAGATDPAALEAASAWRASTRRASAGAGRRMRAEEMKRARDLANADCAK